MSKQGVFPSLADFDSCMLNTIAHHLEFPHKKINIVHFSIFFRSYVVSCNCAPAESDRTAFGAQGKRSVFDLRAVSYETGRCQASNLLEACNRGQRSSLFMSDLPVTAINT